MSGTESDACCCPGDETDGEGKTRNAPGLSAISYRIGDQPSLFKEMLERIASWTAPGTDPPRRPLQALTTRRTDDPAIALMDAWAVTADILTFYQERIANEGFLRTATERLSVRELARQIGYALKPGVAASVYLAWTVEEKDPAPASALVPAGTQVQSLPAASGELPQTFETSEDFAAYRKWNALTLRAAVAQQLSTDTGELLLEGTSPGLRRGDMIVLKPSSGSAKARKVLAVEEELAEGRTRVTLSGGSALALEEEWPELPAATGVAAGDEVIPLSADAVEAQILGQTWDEAALHEWLEYHGWDEETLLGYVAAQTTAGTDVAIFRMQEAVGIYGQNAPRYLSLPTDVRSGSSTDTSKAYPYNWDSGWTIWKDSVTNATYTAADLFLDRELKELTEGQVMVLARPGADPEVLTIADAGTFAMNGFALPLKVTGVTFETVTKSADYALKTSRAFAGQVELAVAEESLEEEIPAGSDQLVLAGMVLGLSTGQRVAITGEVVGAGGEEQTQLGTLAAIEHAGGRTRLTLEEGLAQALVRSTVVINANVTLASHGETVAGEILGSSDGAKAHQRFVLKKPPLTHVAADTASGSESTLEVRVNGVLWEEASLYEAGPADRAYEARQTESGDTVIQFGDGTKGAIPPTALDGVTASYRSGIGLDGEVDAGRITLMKQRPFGAKAVVNPLDAWGAEDPEEMEDARENAPRTVRTLDRVVSVDDHVDFARGFAGIGKASGALLWVGRRQVVHLSLVSASGDELDADALETFRSAVDKVRDPYQDLVVASGTHSTFKLKMGVLIDPDHLWDDVVARIEDALTSAYAFDEQDFGASVYASEILALCQNLEGVVALDFEELALVGGATSALGVNAFLPARTARVDTDGDVHPAEILSLDPVGIELEQRTSL